MKTYDAKTNDLLSTVVGRYLFHAGKLQQTTNPIIYKVLQAMLNIEIDELWMLTQYNSL